MTGVALGMLGKVSSGCLADGSCLPIVIEVEHGWGRCRSWVQHALVRRRGRVQVRLVGLCRLQRVFKRMTLQCGISEGLKDMSPLKLWHDSR